MSAHAEDIDKRIRLFLLIGASLLLLTGLTVGVYFLLDLPKGWAIAVALTIAAIKASMVAAVFMHLVGERGLIYSMLLVTAVFFLALLLAPTLTAADPVAGTEVPHPAPAEGVAGHAEEAHP